MVENIRLELANFQQAQGSQGTNIVISNENDLATLVAEKLFVKIKDDLITRGTGIISEVLASTSLPFYFCLLNLKYILGGIWIKRAHTSPGER